MAKQAEKKNVIAAFSPQMPLANVIELLYHALPHHRAVPGGAREFVKDFRNVASHAPKNRAAGGGQNQRLQERIDRLHSLAKKFREAFQALGYKVLVIRPVPEDAAVALAEAVSK